MNLILSRKGFDSSAGGVPSPIFPDGGMVSLPIPDKSSPVTYNDISYEGSSLGSIVAELTGGRVPGFYRAHIDPDLTATNLPRSPDWRPLFGQTGQAQSHLRNNGVGPEDLFLFFGRFRRVERRNGTYTWDRGSRPCHVIWGWLQVADVLPLDNGHPDGYEWAAYHPHFNWGPERNNVVYIAQRHLMVDGWCDNLPGAGVFSQYSPSLQLTAPDAATATCWQLPDWLYPGEGKRPLTYHPDPQRWHKSGGHTLLTSVARGQEFVLDCDEYPEAIQWICDLIQGMADER